MLSKIFSFKKQHKIRTEVQIHLTLSKWSPEHIERVNITTTL